MLYIILVAFTIFCVLFLTYLDKWYQVLISANYCFSVMEMVICIIQNLNIVAFLDWDIQYHGYEWLQYSCTVIFTWYSKVLQKYCDAAMVLCSKTMVLPWHFMVLYCLLAAAYQWYRILIRLMYKLLLLLNVLWVWNYKWETVLNPPLWKI